MRRRCWGVVGGGLVAAQPSLTLTPHHTRLSQYATPNTVVIETTNSIFNKALYKKITTQCALSWQRAAVATECVWRAVCDGVLSLVCVASVFVFCACVGLCTRMCNSRFRLCFCVCS